LASEELSNWPPEVPGSQAGAAIDEEFARIDIRGGTDALVRAVPEEQPVAMEINGFGYAVLMSSPRELKDLTYGFLHSERLIQNSAQVRYVEPHAVADGILIRIGLVGQSADKVLERVRHRLSESSCGLCGIESIEQALRPLPPVPSPKPPEASAVFRALDGIRSHQALNSATGAVHAAAACGADGEIRLVREDVGRHNAFDKLIGAMLRHDMAWAGGFALLTSRCSYELVEKAVLARCPALVTISAPTALALRRAAQTGLPLRVLARPDSMLAPMP